MVGRIVEDEQLQQALDYLRDSAEETGQARGRLVAAQYRVKRVEALLFLGSEAKTVDAKKMEVRLDARYTAATDEEAEAAAAFEVLRSQREAAIYRIEAWRTEQANYRGMKV